MLHALENRVPPLAVLAVAAGSMFVADCVWPGYDVPLWVRVLTASAAGLGGLAICLAGVLAFRRVGTTVNPLDPGQASRLVDTGIYAVTRNPMYLGMALVLLGLAFWFANPVAALLVLAFALYIDRFQIVPEERALRARFPEAFAAYAARVRRWI